jgi:carbonic anhydrase
MLICSAALLTAGCSNDDNGHEPAAMDDDQAPAGSKSMASSSADHDADKMTGASKDDESSEHEAHWSYTGDGAPQYWGELKDEFLTCKTGKNQSPIDISPVVITDLPDLETNYQPVSLKVINNGHTIQVPYSGSTLTIDGQSYDLIQFHFHSPSEHTIGGKAYDMVAHLVHQNTDGGLAVIGVLFEEGDANPVIETIWAHLPDTNAESEAPDVQVNVADLLPANHVYAQYSGSLTTPPCSEGVHWMVMLTPVTVSRDQVDAFLELFPHSTRPTQPLNGRVVRVDN